MTWFNFSLSANSKINIILNIFYNYTFVTISLRPTASGQHTAHFHGLKPISDFPGQNVSLHNSSLHFAIKLHYRARTGLKFYVMSSYFHIRELENYSQISNQLMSCDNQRDSKFKVRQKVTLLFKGTSLVTLTYVIHIVSLVSV